LLLGHMLRSGGPGGSHENDGVLYIMIGKPRLGFDKFGHNAQQPGVSAVEKPGILIGFQGLAPFVIERTSRGLKDRDAKVGA
jgi:hypothetical protein